MKDKVHLNWFLDACRKNHVKPSAKVQQAFIDYKVRLRESRVLSEVEL